MGDDTVHRVRAALMPGLWEQSYAHDEFYGMTTDSEEGRRQIEAMKPEPIKVGDRVRLKAGRREMRVFGVRDYGNVLECEWYEFNPGGLDPDKEYSYEELSGMSDVVRRHDIFPVRSLVRIT